MSILSRRLGAGVASLAAAASIAVFAAPNAAATVDSITVSGSNHEINKEYTLSAKLSGAGIGLLVYWSVDGEDLSGPKVPMPIGQSSYPWKPTKAGKHLITCSQGGSTKTIEVTVVDPSNPGPVDPGNPGTPGGENGGTGSAGGLGGLLGGLTGSAGK
ncbi:hypothetical protein ABZ319_29830 [Nocardia sp. NPDC005978]|uniref:hypothetical protein n=1 Tax=Nocardia sp. NPDC005978 TaxID=3156725 RepID=UPI0033A90B39